MNNEDGGVAGAEVECELQYSDTITLHYIELHYITLNYITLHYITLNYIELHCITLHERLNVGYNILTPLRSMTQG